LLLQKDPTDLKDLKSCLLLLLLQKDPTDLKDLK
jgi:hypothetical protein